MHSLSISVEAETDLVEIWLFTDEHYGPVQADKYTDQLAEAIHRLSEYPELGKARSDIRANYRSTHVFKHVVFYTVSEDEVFVIRVLHESMDVDQHL